MHWRLSVDAGSSLLGCSSGLLRSLGHLQVAAATASFTHVGLSPTKYGTAASALSWSLLGNAWVPQSLNKWALPALSPTPQDYGIREPPPSDGSQLDTWLRNMSSSGALLMYANSTGSAAGTSSSSSKDIVVMPARLLNAAAIPPSEVTLAPDLMAAAESAWAGWVGTMEVLLAGVAAAVCLHLGIYLVIQKSNLKRPRIHPAAPNIPTGAAGAEGRQVVAVAFPKVLLMVLYVGFPPVMYWAGCLWSSGQVWWLVLVVVGGSGLGVAGVVAGMLQAALAATEQVRGGTG